MSSTSGGSQVAETKKHLHKNSAQELCSVADMQCNSSFKVSIIEFICAGSNKTLMHGHHLCQVYYCHTELHLTLQYSFVYIYYLILK